MARYDVEVRLTGYVTVTVEAEDEEEARELAIDMADPFEMEDVNGEVEDITFLDD